MKKLKLIPVLALVFMINVASMCSSDDNSSSSSSPDVNQVTNNTTSGTWRVTLYNEDGTIKTSNYAGYAFTFASDGALTAVNGSSTQSGTWNIYSDSGSTKLDILFSASSGPFESISEDWNVLSSTGTKLELKHVSGGDGSTDLLTFQKN